MDKEVIDFINKFKFIYPKELEKVFLEGNCYYFALILYNRFPDSIIKLMCIDNHFVVDICGQLYDIRGNVTDICNVDDLISFDKLKEQDCTYYNRIVRDCIKKLT